MNPLLLTDFYKTGHWKQYPEGTELIFTNFTPRSSMIDRVDHIIWFGLQYFIKKYLIEVWNQDYYYHNIHDLHIADFNALLDVSLGQPNNEEFIVRLRALAKLKYLPLIIYSLPEGSRVPIGCPTMVMWNTDPDFYWLPNFVETLLSATVWGMSTSATIADRFKTLLRQGCYVTGGNMEVLPYQGHDFSMRGMYGVEAAALSGAGHLLSFKGTDTIPAIELLSKYYNAPYDCGASVAATEHSVMCAYGKENEYECIERLIDLYPNSIVSIVADTWDLWNVVTNILPRLRDKIIDGTTKVVIRPDSGDPAEIICGRRDFRSDYPEIEADPRLNGVVDCLFKIFGGFTNKAGCRVLHANIGVIYGDSITYERAQCIINRLQAKGYASTNIIFGLGSYTYQYNTRDTFGWAMKSTYIEIYGKGIPIFKDPVTDNGTKKSAKGLLKVTYDGSEYHLQDQITWDEFYMPDNAMVKVFENGKITHHQTYNDIVRRMK